MKQDQILLGIFTRNSYKSVALALEKFEGIRMSDFAVIISRDDALPKPHPDGVYQAARHMGITISELLVVGDFRFDIMAGYAAGARTVLLTNGSKSTMAAEDPQPDFTIGCLKDLLNIVKLPLPET